LNSHKELENKLKVSPDMLWNKEVMKQQVFTAVFVLAVYAVILFLLKGSFKPFLGLHRWHESFIDLFMTPKWYKEIFMGIIAGTLISHLIVGLDLLVGSIMRKDIRKWLHRTDYLLPRTSSEKKWAFSITLLASTLEEIIFRAYILLAILPIWSHPIWAVLLLSAAFALLHGSLQGFWSTVWIFLVSIALCLSIVAGLSIYFVAAMHILVNLNNLFVIPILYYKKKKNQE